MSISRHNDFKSRNTKRRTDELITELQDLRYENRLMEYSLATLETRRLREVKLKWVVEPEGTKKHLLRNNHPI